MKVLLLLGVLVLTGCAAQNHSSGEMFSTMDIVYAAAKSAPQGIDGTFTLSIQASGSQNNFVYLNTESDYRDQRNISVALSPSTVEQFIAKYGTHPQQFFVGKTLSVSGEAKRVKIRFIADGRVTNKYYYQTHIKVKDITQIELESIRD